MSLNKDENLHITQKEPATEEQKKQAGTMHKAALTSILGLMTGVAFVASVNSNNPETTTQETTVESTGENLHDQTADLFAQKLNMEAGTTVSVEPNVASTDTKQDPVSVYLIQNQNSETGKWETKEIKVNGKFESRPQGTPGSKIVCAGEYGNKDDMFSVYSKETRADINSPWVSTGEYAITLTKPTDNETTRYIIEGVNPYAKTMEPSFVKSSVSVAELPDANPLPYEANVPNNQQVENSFVSTPKEDLISTKREEEHEQLDNQVFNDIKNEIIGEGVKVK